MSKVVNLKEIIGKGYKEFFNFKGRYTIIKGSRGSKKSYTTAIYIIYTMLRYPLSNILVIRKTGETLRDSVFAQLKTAIDRLQVSHLFKATVSPLEITCLLNGNKIIFRGLDDPLKLTSITVNKGVLNIVWFEEAYEIMKEDDFNKVDMSIRGALPEGYYKRIILTFNPWNNTHFLYKRFFEPYDEKLEELEEKGSVIHHKDDNLLVMSTNYKVNEFLGRDDIKIYENMKLNNPNRYNIEGIGNWGIADGLVFDNWETMLFSVEDLMRENPNIHKTFGLDFGYQADPTALSCSLVDLNKKVIYIYDEYYKTKMTNPDIYNMICDKGYDCESITADSAEQKSIEELKLLGMPLIHGAKKGKDSIMHGIQYLQQFKIYIHPKCVNAIKEFGLYSWSKDRQGNSLNKPEDKNNHFIDSLRYSMERFLTPKKKNKIVSSTTFWG